MIESTYSVSSFDGFVSSKRKLVLPPNSSASPKSRQIALAWPMCRYPFGSGGKRVCTRPPCLPVRMSSATISRTKSSGATGAEVPASESIQQLLQRLDVFCGCVLGESHQVHLLQDPRDGVNRFGGRNLLGGRHLQVLHAARGDEDARFARTGGLMVGLDGASQPFPVFVQVSRKDRKALVELAPERRDLPEILGERLLPPRVRHGRQQRDQRDRARQQ